MNGPPDSRERAPSSSLRALPREVASFVSRTTELEALRAHFATHRLVTIVGTYGIGKTRLALRFGWREQERHPGSVTFCDLVSATTVEDLCATVTCATGLASPGEPPLSPEAIGTRLASLGEVLVILDNFEHLLHRAAPVVSSWLGMAPRARFLVTSRERLRLADEACLQLGPLDVEDAVKLLVQRARNLVPDLGVDDHNREPMADICRQLDGVPLALEMTAPWLQVLSAAELGQRLHNGLSLLHDGAPAHGRHASLENAITWSWNLLSPEEREFMCQAAIFRGRFTHDDALAVVVLPAGASAILMLLRRLRERSLLTTIRNAAAGRVDFAMSLSVRNYALARLVPDDATAGLEARYRARILAVAARGLEVLDTQDGSAANQASCELVRLRADLLWLEADAPAVEARLIGRALAVARGLPAPSAEPPLEPPPASSNAPSTEAPQADPASSVTLTVHSRGDWFRADDGAPISLGRRGPIRQILLGLVDRARRLPGEPASLEGVCELGWPGERMTPEAAANRVYAAISALRRLGLTEVLSTRRGGWLIDPGVVIATED